MAYVNIGNTLVYSKKSNPSLAGIHGLDDFICLLIVMEFPSRSVVLLSLSLIPSMGEAKNLLPSNYINADYIKTGFFFSHFPFYLCQKYTDT